MHKTKIWQGVYFCMCVCVCGVGYHMYGVITFFILNCWVDGKYGGLDQL